MLALASHNVNFCCRPAGLVSSAGSPLTWLAGSVTSTRCFFNGSSYYRLFSLHYRFLKLICVSQLTTGNVWVVLIKGNLRLTWQQSWIGWFVWIFSLFCLFFFGGKWLCGFANKLVFSLTLRARGLSKNICFWLSFQVKCVIRKYFYRISVWIIAI